MAVRSVRLAVLADMRQATADLDKFAAKVDAIFGRTKVLKAEMAKIPTADLRSAEASGLLAGDSFGKKFGEGTVKALNVAGKAAAAVLVAGLALSLKEGMKLQQAQAQLNNALKDTGTTFKAIAPQLDAVSQRMAKYGYTDDQVYLSVAQLTRATGSSHLALGLESTAADLAASKHIDLASATQLLARSIGTGGRVLKQLGVTLVTGSTSAAAMSKAMTTLDDQVQTAGGIAKFAAAQHMDLATAEDLVTQASGRASAATQTLAGHGTTLAAVSKLVTEAHDGDAAATGKLAKMGLTLSDAQSLVTSAASGSISAYNKLGIEVLPTTATAAQKLAQTQAILNARLGGAAAAQAATFSGKLAGMRANLMDLAEKIGIDLLPALSAMAGVFAKLFASQTACKAFAVVVLVLAGAWVALRIAALLSIDSIKGALISSGIGAILVVIGILLMLVFTHWKTIKAWLDSAWKATTRDVINWWDDIWNAGKVCVDSIDKAWKGLQTDFHRIVNDISTVAKVTWDYIKLAGLEAVATILQGFSHIPIIGHYFATAEGQVKQWIRNIQGDISHLTGKNVNIGANFQAIYGSGGKGTPAGLSAATGGPIRGPGSGVSDSIPAWLSNGEYVITAAAHRYYGTGILDSINARHFAAGGGANITASTSLTPSSSIQNAIGTAILSTATSWAKQTMASGGGGNFGSIGGGVLRWRPEVLAVLAMLGEPSTLAPRVLYQMQTESGGNPYAINLTDSNAAAGDPSRGLLQCIMSTFQEWRSFALPDNIYNPMANIFAAVNYAMHTYGLSLMRGGMGMGSGHGYDQGGLLMPGMTLAYNGTGKPERVIPPGGAAGITVNVYCHPSNNPDETAAEIHKMLRKLKVHRGGQSLGF